MSGVLSLLFVKQPKMLIDIYCSKIEGAKEAVKKSKAIALTSDLLTSLCNESYCGTIGHWITDEWI